MNFENYSRVINMTKETLWKRIPWKDNKELRLQVNNVCHWGQLKLFYSELEFILICIQNNINLSESTVVYIGAAPGTHINYLHNLFPELHWILIDPNRFNIHNNEYISIITGQDGFFTDDSIPFLLKHPFLQKYKNILFISDIRTKTQELTIFNEMLNQQRWLLKIQADMAMLKFRLPYTIENENNDWNYSMDNIKQYIKLTKGRPCSSKKNNMCYLYGDIYVQLFPPIYSTETRLIVNKQRDKYKMHNYDTIKYEEKCYYYNTTIRLMELTYEDSHLLKYDIINAQDNYETCSEYLIAKQYLECTKKEVNYNNIVHFIYKIRNLHNALAVQINNVRMYKSLAICPLLTLFLDKFSTYDKFLDYIHKKEFTKDEVNIYFTKITNLFDNNLLFIKKQIGYFENGKILEKEQYQQQMNILQKSIEYNTIIYNIFNRYYSNYINN